MSEETGWEKKIRELTAANEDLAKPLKGAQERIEELVQEIIRAYEDAERG